MTPPSPSTRAFATLRAMAPPRAVTETCELCRVALGPAHQHLIEPVHRQLRCCCDACAILFSGDADTKYLRVPRRRQILLDFQMSDAIWEGLAIPISMAFMFQSRVDGRVLALYPSPAGATESQLSAEAWAALVAENPVLAELEPEVEALLVNRLGAVPRYYRVPIDECYRLVGIIRGQWRGLSGGAAVWTAIAEFFDRLTERSTPRGAPANA